MTADEVTDSYKFHEFRYSTQGVTECEVAGGGEIPGTWEHLKDELSLTLCK